MSSKTSENTVNSKDGAKTSAKINAFQFMMNSRHKVIGSNSPGKEKKDVELKSPEMTEKIKEKQSKRKAIFEDWAEKKGGTKRKLLDEAAEKHINKTLHKRAKRLKKMLDIINEELKNSGEEGSDSEEVVKVKTKKRRKPVFIDSDNSSNADDRNGSESEKVFSKNVKENGDDKEQIKTRSKDELEINTPENNIEEDGEQSKDASKEATKMKYLKDNGQENIEKNAEVTEVQIKKTPKEKKCINPSDINEKESIINNCENKGKENNKTPEITLVKKGKTETNSGKKKIRKRSLSLKKTKDVEKSPTPQKNKLDNFQENNACDQLSDEEIFPTKKLEAIKKSRQLKLINNSTLNTKKNDDVKKESFSPRAWRMKLKAVDNEETDKNKESKDSDNENSQDKEFEKEIDENQESENVEDSFEVDDSLQKHVTKQEIANSSGELNISGSETKKQVKLAPIFLKQKSKKVDKNVLNAKKSFLHSGMPSKVKKLMTKSKSFQEPEYTLNTFPQISHIQQRAADESLNTFWKLPEASLKLTERETNTKLLFDQINIGSFTNCKSIDINLNTDSHHAPPLKYKNLKEIVKEIKKEHPSYPVYKTFRLLYQKYEKHIYKPEPKIEVPPKTEDPSKRKRGRPKKKKEVTQTEPVSESPRELQVWTEKYKPQSQEDIIGNTTSVQELKSWLESWIRYSEDQKSSRKRRRSNSSDDFCSDSTTKDSDNLPQNLILLFGPLGSGKTSSVYGLCNELSINVIEINASSKRTGKKILADLQEATQSHQVKNTDSKSVNGFFQKKPDSQNDDDVNKKLSLLLFEDVDIVFEDQDDNFISAVGTLVTSSKRPIILTYTDKKCWYLQKFIMQYSVITFNSLTSRILGPWLQILCLVEGVKADKDMIDKLVQWNKGDVRKIILQLQFWTQTGGDLQNKSDLVENTSSNTAERSTEEEICVDDKSIKSDLVENTSSKTADRSTEKEICVDDESSDILWMTAEDNCDTQDKNSNYCHQDCAESFIPYYERDKEGFKLSYPVNLEVLWWNIPDILGQNTNNFLTNKKIKKKDEVVTNCNSKYIDSKSSLDELNTTVNLLESLAVADVVHTRLKTEFYDEPIYNYWQVNPVNSLSLNENFSMYNEDNNTSLEITHWVVENSVKQCQNLSENKSIKLGVNNTVPYFVEVSWRSKRHKSMKDLLSAVPTFSILDRRAICEDYQTILRSISRTEHERSVSNSKRKNRFYHYLKNFSIHLNDSTYLLLCKTLATNNVD